MTIAFPLPSTSAYEDSPVDLPADSLSSQLQHQLWRRIIERLQRGDALMTNRAFLHAMEEEYSALTQSLPAQNTRKYLWDIIARVNDIHPETFLHNGIENAITRAFLATSEKLRWSSAHIEAHGLSAIRRFMSGQMRDVLRHIGVEVRHLDLVNCVRNTAKEQRDREFGNNSISEESIQLRPQPTLAAKREIARETLPTEIGYEAQQAISEGLLDTEEIKERHSEQQQLRGQIDHEETEKIPERLDTYIKQGIITLSEAENLRRVYSTAAPLKRQDRAFVRSRIEEKVRPSIEETVDYLELFDSLRRLPETRDLSLRFLLRHAAAVLGREAIDTAIAELEADPELLDGVLSIADRTDQEISMIAVRLPPYGKALQQAGHLETPAAQAFVDAFRNLQRDALSDRLNDGEAAHRRGVINGLLSIVLLLDHTSRQTPFFQQLRILRIDRQLKEIVTTARDSSQARAKVDAFLQRRMLYLYPDLTAFEKTTAKEHAERLLQPPISAAVIEKKEKERESPEVDGLAPYEVEMGVRIARVATRVAGRSRYVPQKVMADPDDAEKFLIVRRDPASNSIAPALQRGAKRYVEKDRDGFWKMVK
ncbi:MAG: hypothetical protein ACI906_003377 [Candidatus Latescibacterota bacterium]|jgi:hypothetical protein